MPKHNRRRTSVLLASQTVYHLQNMAQFCGHKDIGRVIDKLVREKRLEQNESTRGGARSHATDERPHRRQDR